MENNKLIDMHIHTVNSDGEYQVEEIVEMIRENDIGIFSITDHDDIESINQIRNVNLDGLEFYSGVEISSEYNHIGMHILGYDFQHIKEMKSLVNKVQLNRKKRCLELIEMLSKEYGITITDDLTRDILRHNVVGRPHVVQALYKLGYGKNNREIFDRYFKNYTSKTKYRVNAKEVVETIKKANGLVIIAHPKEIEKRHHITFDTILPDLIELGIDGIEVYNSIHGLEDMERYKSLAQEYNLLISGGSDYHGPFVKPDVVLGGVSKEKSTIKKLSLVDELRRRNNK